MDHASAQRSALPDWLVQNRNFVLLWAAYGISAIGDHLSELALLSELGGMERSNTTRVQALIGFGFFLPFVILGPFAGWWADRFSRKWTMIGTDILRAIIVVNLLVIVPFLLARGLGDYAVVLPLVLAGAMAAFFSPCRQALLPTLIRDDQLVRANALISALGTIGTILSAVLGGLILMKWGKLWNYRLDGLTFVLSATLLVFIVTSGTRAAPRKQMQGLWSPIMSGFRYVGTHRSVRQLILIGTVFWAGAGAVMSIVPALVRDVFGGDIADAGIYRGLIGIGLAGGAAVMTIFGATIPIQVAVLFSMAGAGFWALVLALTSAVGGAGAIGGVIAGLSLVMIGAHGAGLLVTVTANLQRFVPDARRGRVFGVADMATMAAMVATTGALGIPDIPNLDKYVPLILAVVGVGFLAASWRTWRIYRSTSRISRSLEFVLWGLQFYLHYWARLKRSGPSTVPASGPVIVACNHTAAIDPLVLQVTSLHRTIGFIVAREHYRVPIAGWIMSLVGCIPINRDHPGKAFYKPSLALLKRGGCLGIFPHGTFHAPDEEPPEIRMGVGMLALRTGATVIPCHISGTTYSPHAFGSLLRRHNVQIRYGKPVDLSAFANRGKDREAMREASDLIMREIEQLGEDETQ